MLSTKKLMANKELVWLSSTGICCRLSEMNSKYIINCINMLEKMIKHQPEAVVECREFDGKSLKSVIKDADDWVVLLKAELKIREKLK